MVEKKILIVEDDEAIRLSLQQFLQLEGYECITSANGAEALMLLRTGPPISLILLDLMMPIMGGEKFLELLEAEMPELKRPPVLILSAVGNLRSLSSLKAAGIVTKPIEIGVLLENIRRHLGG